MHERLEWCGYFKSRLWLKTAYFNYIKYQCQFKTSGPAEQLVTSNWDLEWGCFMLWIEISSFGFRQGDWFDVCLWVWVGRNGGEWFLVGDLNVRDMICVWGLLASLVVGKKYIDRVWLKNQLENIPSIIIWCYLHFDKYNCSVEINVTDNRHFALSILQG